MYEGLGENFFKKAAKVAFGVPAAFFKYPLKAVSAVVKPISKSGAKNISRIADTTGVALNPIKMIEAKRRDPKLFRRGRNLVLGTAAIAATAGMLLAPGAGAGAGAAGTGAVGTGTGAAGAGAAGAAAAASAIGTGTDVISALTDTSNIVKTLIEPTTPPTTPPAPTKPILAGMSSDVFLFVGLAALTGAAYLIFNGKKHERKSN